MFTKKDSGGFDQPTPASPATRPASASPMAQPTNTMPPKSSPMTTGKVVPSIIGTDLTVTGNVISKGEVQVDGVIQGDIHCTSLIVGEKAQITGGIVAEDVVVRGRVNGSIRGVRVTLQSSSQVDGDIFHKSIAIEQGAYFEGKSRRTEDPISSAPKVDQSPAASSSMTSSADTSKPAASTTGSFLSGKTS